MMILMSKRNSTNIFFLNLTTSKILIKDIQTYFKSFLILRSEILNKSKSIEILIEKKKTIIFNIINRFFFNQIP